MKQVFAAGLFDGDVAIVTGGGTGIGLAIARTLGTLGAKVALCGRRPEPLEEARASLAAAGVTVFTRTCDIREPTQIAAFLDGVEGELGRTTVLVNNAGGQFPTLAEDLSPRGWEAVIRNNLNGTFNMTQAVATRHLIPAKHGRIVNITANVRRGFPGMVHTGAARAGVENMTKTLAVEWVRYGIRINAIAPGIILSSGTDRYPPELVELARKATPMRRLGSPEEVANLVAYLASPAAAFVTGEVWGIDGGASLWGDTWQIPEE